MPRYELTTDDELTRSQKDQLAHEITDVHVAVTGAPRSIVHVIFWTTGSGNAYVGGQQRPGTYLQGSVRAGRDADTISTLLHDLAAAVERATGAAADEVTVALRETPTHLVLEGGRTVGEPGAENPAFTGRASGP
ncbi:MAG TPA: tautomerase family protein [Actinomycetospora sp.]|uniref:tautomerase family protein n=1 Tax=Actinomycetospora sp. TaxID=1872135 RepID=UPI002F3E349D